MGLWVLFLLIGRPNFKHSVKKETVYKTFLYPITLIIAFGPIIWVCAL
jgi:hypothetical protein